MKAEQLIIVLLLGGLLGMCGQGIRVIAGLKKSHDKAALAGENFKENFELKTLIVSLIIGFMAGILGALALWDKLASDNLQAETAMALLGAGYGGTDFIEAFMSRAQAKALPTDGPISSPAAVEPLPCEVSKVDMPEPSAVSEPIDPAVG
ncbi:MAG: hypothetical protein PHS51_08515 [Gallionella sp.]|nr:hypothetical protein [Gallionella sp.]